jgi:hypothetical protein
MWRGSVLLIGLGFMSLLVAGCGGSSGSGARPFREQIAQAENAAKKVPQPDMQMQALQKIRSLMGKLPNGEG